jgi:hypothetical protein
LCVTFGVAKQKWRCCGGRACTKRAHVAPKTLKKETAAEPPQKRVKTASTRAIAFRGQGSELCLPLAAEIAASNSLFVVLCSGLPDVLQKTR